MTFDELLDRIERDQELLDQLLEAGVLPGPRNRDFSDEEADHVRVARTLYRELEVNAPGVEIILHMRRQILGLRRQMLALLEQLQG